MTLKEGANNEINSRWPEHKQRNTALYSEWYGKRYKSDMMAGIQIVRDRYHSLKANGANAWSTTQDMRDLLDSLAGI